MLPCPSTSTMSASLAPSSTSRSAAPAMKSATTASTAMPQPSIMMPVCPVATKRVRTPRSLSCRVSWSWAVILPTLQSVPTVSTTNGSTAFARPEAIGRSGGRPAEVEDPPAVRRGLGREQRIVGEKGVQAVPEIAAVIERLGQPRAPLVGQPSAQRRDADQYGIGLEREPSSHRPDDRDRAAESENVLRRSARPCCGRARHDPVRLIPDDGVGGLGGHGPEVAVGDDEEARSSHGSGVGTGGDGGLGVGRTGAGVARLLQRIAVDLAQQDVADEHHDRAPGWARR